MSTSAISSAAGMDDDIGETGHRPVPDTVEVGQERPKEWMTRGSSSTLTFSVPTASARTARSSSLTREAGTSNPPRSGIRGRGAFHRSRPTFSFAIAAEGGLRLPAELDAVGAPAPPAVSPDLVDAQRCAHVLVPSSVV